MGIKLTGISLPWLGLQWVKTDSDRDIARRVLTFLEDRRVLFADIEFETGRACVWSATQIRAYLTSELQTANPGKELANSLRAMRAACRKFVEAGGPEEFVRHSRSFEHLSHHLGDLRTLIGIQIASLAIAYDLEIELDLASILPPQPSDDLDAVAWIPGFDEPVM
ncbi:MAG TPA: DUF6650 family protein [Candidatus Limnocylindrales bacterium]|nr:DUF6650 family protein [Candidatus Limnocylindrales bacterium]